MYISKKKRNRDEYIQERQNDTIAATPTLSQDIYAEDEAQSVDEATHALPSKDLSLGTESAADTFENIDVAEVLERSINNSTEMVETDEGEGRVSDGEISVPTDPQDLDTVPDTSADMTYEEFMRTNTESGVLRVQVSSGNRSIPLVNVNIEVYKDFLDGRNLFYKAVTNADGVVDNLKLPAPPRENSVLGNGSSPFASYVVNATRDGLVSETVENVPVFSGVKSIQGINMSSSL